MTQFLAHLDELAERFDCFLLDQYGVLLDGTAAYDYAPAALVRLAAATRSRAGGERHEVPILILSNSGKRAIHNEARLTKFGFQRESYQAVLSSGEVAFWHLMKRLRKHKGSDQETRVLVLSRDGDLAGLDDLSNLLVTPTDQASDADLILLAASRGDIMSLDAYASQLLPAAKRGTPCLCTNPDMTMLTRGGLHFGAGRIADLYEEMGGPVEWIGKPYAMMYRRALEMLGNPEPNRVICIGDSPMHDIRGGLDAGCKTALVQTGIHQEASQEELLAQCQKIQAVPDFILPKFDFST